MKIKGARKVSTYIKNEKLISERRQQIISGAMKVFKEKSFHSASVREIAEAAGMTMGTMYNYVRTKEDILYIVYEYMTNILQKEMMEAIEGIDEPMEQLRAALKQNMDTVYEHQDIIMFLYKESSSHDKQSLRTVLKQESRYVEVFEELLRKGFEGKKVNEFRLKLAADILAYMPVILTLRRWSLTRRFDSMEDVKQGILDYLKQSIEYIEEKT